MYFTGHFEEQILFGYDADLVQVHAKFDGHILRIFVPRHPLSISNMLRSRSSHNS
jgi:hypothetical protein